MSASDWRERTRQQAARVAERCSSSGGSANAAEAPSGHARKPPHTAFCIVGSARSFATPLVLTMLRHNLYGALGAASSSRFFLQLKQLDSNKPHITGSTSFSQHNETTVSSLLAALETPWLHRVTAEALIVDGEGASNATASGTDGRVVLPDDALWRQYRATRCKMSDYLMQSNNQERMLLHHLGLGWCRAAIGRYETRTGRAFDLVVYSRPDLVWWNPILPWCELRWQHQIIACHEPGCDMAWIAPRHAGELLMQTAEQHRDCTEFACCSTSERLLWHAQALAVKQFGVSVNKTVGTALFHSQDAYNGRGAILRAAKQPASLLRFVRGVCQLAFDRAFAPDAKVDRHTKDAFRFIPNRGLPIATIASLRRTLNDSQADCRQALTWVGAARGADACVGGLRLAGASLPCG